MGPDSGSSPIDKSFSFFHFTGDMGATLQRGLRDKTVDPPSIHKFFPLFSLFALQATWAHPCNGGSGTRRWIPSIVLLSCEWNEGSLARLTCFVLLLPGIYEWFNIDILLGSWFPGIYDWFNIDNQLGSWLVHMDGLT